MNRIYSIDLQVSINAKTHYTLAAFAHVLIKSELIEAFGDYLYDVIVILLIAYVSRLSSSKV